MRRNVWLKFERLLKPAAQQIRQCSSTPHNTPHEGGVFKSVKKLFDDLAAMGLNCFNPFQPEVMDTTALLGKYRGRLAFHGGLSTQRTLPYGSAEEIHAQSMRLLKQGRDGGYIFAPAHAVESDVPLENILSFLNAAHTCRSDQFTPSSHHASGAGIL